MGTWTLMSEQKPESRDGQQIEYWDRSIDPDGRIAKSLKYCQKLVAWLDDDGNAVPLQPCGTWRDAPPDITIEPGEEFGSEKFDVARKMQDDGVVFELLKTGGRWARPVTAPFGFQFVSGNRYRRTPLPDGWITSYWPSANDTCEAANDCVEVSYKTGLMGWEDCDNDDLRELGVIAWRKIRPAYVPSN